jgi:hypothetical protein
VKYIVPDRFKVGYGLSLPKGRGQKLIDTNPGKTAREDIKPAINGDTGKITDDV